MWGPGVNPWNALSFSLSLSLPETTQVLMGRELIIWIYPYLLWYRSVQPVKVMVQIYFAWVAKMLVVYAQVTFIYSFVYWLRGWLWIYTRQVLPLNHLVSSHFVLRQGLTTVAEASLELAIFLPQPPKGRDCKWFLSCLAPIKYLQQNFTANTMCFMDI